LRLNDEIVESIVDGLYVAAVQPHRWDSLLRQLADASGSADCALQGIHCSDTGVSPGFLLGSRLDEAATRDYARLTEEINDVRIAYAASQPIGTTFQDVDFLSIREIRRHPYYLGLTKIRDFWFTASTPCLQIATEAGLWRSGFGLQRSFKQGPLAGDEWKLWTSIAPHLAQSLRLAFRLGTLAFSGPCQTPSPAPIELSLDRHGRLLHSHRQASDAGHEDFVTAGRAGAYRLEPAALHAAVNSGVRLLMQHRSMRAFHGSLPHAGNEIRYTLRRVPAGPRGLRKDATRTAAFVVTIEATTDIRPADPLTSAEARIVQQLSEGKSTRQIARDGDITYETVRSHVKHAMNKYGVHSQLELVLGWTRRTGH
jgi:DNA-binding CsgD family transcriptional regulator